MSLKIKRQICGIKCQSEVKPVPTELEYIVEGLENSSAQRETGIRNSLMFSAVILLLFTSSWSVLSRFSFISLANSNHLSNLRLASSTTRLPPPHHLFQLLSNFLHLSFFTDLLLSFYTFLLLYLTVSLWDGFSVGTGSGSAGSRGTVADSHFFFLGDGVERYCCPLLLVLELKLVLG